MLGAAAAAVPILGQAIETGGALWANAQNIKEAQKNRDWQERMANTAHQREQADLKAAGLNPILSVVKGGPGAITPSGALARVENPGGGAGSNAVALIRVLNESRLAAEQIAEIVARTRLVEAQTGAVPSQVAHTRASTELAEADAFLRGAQLRETSAKARLHELEAPAAENWARIARSVGLTMTELLGKDDKSLRELWDTYWKKYLEKMDLFGTRFIPEFQAPTPSALWQKYVGPAVKGSAARFLEWYLPPSAWQGLRRRFEDGAGVESGGVNGSRR